MASVPHTPEAFYLPTPDPDVYVATRRTEGLWSAGTQHAGPPSALLTRAIERLPSTIGGPSQITRLTFEILGPVPTGEIRLAVAVTRPGRTVEHIEGQLEGSGRVAMRVRAWRMRTSELSLPEVDGHLPPPPEMPATPATFRDASWSEVYLGSVEWRFVSGHIEKPGPAVVWSRLRIPLVADEEPTPTQRLVTVADSGNGLSNLLSFERWWYINTDLSIHLHRLPRDEWICVDARSTLDASGVGLAETELFDRDGRVGRGAQSLLVGPR
jgi:Thioesterase-like superfamily